MFCTNCGKEMSSDMKFCANCGSKIVANTNTNVHVRVASINNKQEIQKDTGVSNVSDSTIYVRGSSMVAPQTTQAQARRQAQNREPDMLERFIKWLSEDWLMKLGALLLLLAIGWFAQYAFANDWISATARIALGFIIGAGIMVGGYFRSLSYKAQGGVLLALGSASILLVMFAAREVYDFFNPISALILTFVPMALAMAAALKFNNRALAFISVALAGLTPVLVTSLDVSFFSIFSYLFIVTLGSLWVAYFTDWRELVLENFIIVSLFSLPYWLDLVEVSRVGMSEMLFAFAFAAVFFVTNLTGIIKVQATETRFTDMLTAFGTGIFIFIWTVVAAPSELQTFIVLVWALVFAIGSYSVYVGTRAIAPLILYGGVAAALVAFATAIEFDGTVLMMAYTAEIAIVTVVSALLTRKRGVATGVSLLFAIPILASLEYLMSSSWAYSASFDGAIAVYTLVAAMLATAITVMVVLPLPEDSQLDKVTMPSVLIGISGMYVFLLIWMIPHALYLYTAATAISLVIYTAIGLTAYFAAPHLLKGKYEFTLHRFGQVVLAGVVVRLLLVDVWQLALTGRIIVFALVGVALISTAFATRSHK